jgi:hypothetical protein
MLWKEYFKLDWKKPQEDNEIKSLRTKKDLAKEGINKCYSRLETIEICTSNSKISDAVLLSKHLKIDIYNLILSFIGQKSVDSLDDLKISSEKIQNKELIEIFKPIYESIKLETEEEDIILQNESVFSEVLYKLEKYFSSTTENPIDNFYTRIKAQSIFFSIILVISIGYAGKNYYEKRPLKDDLFILDTSISKEKLPSGENSINVDIHPEKGWERLSFVYKEPKDLEVIKFTPIRQSKARIQLKNLKIYDINDKMIYEKDFLLQNLDLTEFTKTFQTDQIYPGKLTIGKPIEIESVGPNPVIHFFPEKKLEKVLKIEIETRMTKRVNKFLD